MYRVQNKTKGFAEHIKVRKGFDEFKVGNVGGKRKK